MKKLFIYSALCAACLLTNPATADARDKGRGKNREHYSDYSNRGDGRYRDERSRYRDRTRTIYVIENRRPVERVVYVDGDGGYYRMVDGRRSYVRSRYYTSYPSRYYYADGRRRVGFSFFFNR